MAIRDIVLYPDDPLTQKAEAYETIGPGLVQLAEDMFETMDAYEGVGLAGPQIGLAKRIFVLREPEGEEMCLINPELSDMEGREEGEEGCLSLPGIFAPVPRATRVRVQALDQFGEALDFVATDFLARIIQHEYDHLNGVIFLDRVDLLTRQDRMMEWNEARAEIQASYERDRAES